MSGSVVTDGPVLRRLRRPLVISVLLGIGLYLVAMLAGDLRAVTLAAAQLGAVGWSSILSLSLLNYGLRFLRWHAYLHQLGSQVPRAWDLAYYLAGFAFTTTPGKAGEATRSLYLKQHGVAYSQSLATLFVERLLDLVTMILLTFSAVAAYQNARWPVLAAATLALAALPLIRHRGLRGWLEKATGNRSPRVSSAIQHLGALLSASAKLLRPRMFYSGIAIGMLAWGAEGIGFWIVLDRLEVPVALPLAVGIYAVGILAGALSFLPGGLGSTEAVMVLLLGLAGVDIAIALPATLICRIATLWFAVALGLLVMAGLELRRASQSPGSTKTSTQGS